MNPELRWLDDHLSEDRGHVVRRVDDGLLLAEDIDGEHAFIVREIDDVDEWLEWASDSP